MNVDDGLENQVDPWSKGSWTHLVFFFFVSMFSGWHKSKEAHFGTRFWPFFHSYAIGYGSHAPHFFLPFKVILVGYVQKSELWQQVMPSCHRYARLWSPCAPFVWTVHLMALTANYQGFSRVMTRPAGRVRRF